MALSHGNGKDDHTWPVPYEGNGGRSVGQGRSSTCTQSEIIAKCICLNRQMYLSEIKKTYLAKLQIDVV